MPFESPDLNLKDLLSGVDTGKVQLPDFQRPWKWDTDRIASLLASISVGHPVGVVMMLETGGADVRFKPRPLANALVADGTTPEQLLLDGQQRLTSLFQALKSGLPVDTFDARTAKRLRQWFYVDIEKALDPEVDHEEAIFAVPEDRIVRENFGRDVKLDLSTLEREVEHEAFPLALVFDSAAIFRWHGAYLQHGPHEMATALERWNAFYSSVVEQFLGYTVPVIVLKKETSKEAVCTVFEKVNTGGVVLNVFELLTATYASDDFRLADDWAQREHQLHATPVLAELQNTDFLQAVTLVATVRKQGAVSCRRKDILKLGLEDYREVADAVTEGFAWAARFLAMERVLAARDVPYRTQLVPLAALRALLGSRADDLAVTGKLRNWFWCGVLGELYSGAVETRFARDIEQVPAWLDGGAIPRTVADASFDASRLLTMRTRNSAAYKGVYALLMRGGCQDWLKNFELDQAQFFGHRVDIHHVFPRSWCDARGIDAPRRDCIVNKTALSYDTNRSLGGNAPSTYVGTIERRTKLSPEAVDARIETHAINPSPLRADDFEAFFLDRRAALLDLIAQAMGKEVTGREQEPTTPPEEDFEASVLGEDESDLEDESLAVDALASAA